MEFEASDTTKLKLVTSLDLSVNVIDTLGVGYPDYAPALTTLNLANNSIAALKVDQFSPVLTSIDLSANKIASIEAGTFKTPELLTLKMAANQLSAFPIAAFTGATKVSTLDLSANKFIAFPTEAVNGLATTLTTLDLSQNQITELKGEFLGNNNGIKTLKLVNNRINSINLDVINSANRCFNSIDFTGNPIFNGLTVTSDTTNAACKKITCKSSNSLKDVCTYNSSGRLATGSLWLLVTFVGAYFIRH